MIPRYTRPAIGAIWSESGKYDRWLAVQLAVCEAWTDAGVIPPGDMAKLRGATWDIAKLEARLAETKHDMTAFLYSVTSGLGAEGRWLHFGLTTNDVWDTATALQLRDSAELLLDGVRLFIDTLGRRAVEFKHTLQMGRTHGVHAEPITFGLKLALWREEMRRNLARLERARDEIAAGKISGPVGTHATVPPEVEQAACERLGLGVAALSNQIVQRDRHAAFVSALALVAASLEKFATEVRGLQRTEVHEVEEPFGEGQTGSSSMPHKRNPELSERVCGLARLIRGHTVTMLENVALWHERDISHSSAERIILPDACIALDYILDLFNGVVDGMRVDQERMLANIESTRGLVFSQRVMLALIEKGMARDDAYRLIQSHTHTAWDHAADFRELVRGDSLIAEHLGANEIEALFDYRWYTRHVDALFDRVGLKETTSALT